MGSNIYYVLNTDAKIIKYKDNYQLQLNNIKSIDFLSDNTTDEMNVVDFFDRDHLKQFYNQHITIHHTFKKYKFVVSSNDSIRSKKSKTIKNCSLLLPLDKEYVPKVTHFNNIRLIITIRVSEPSKFSSSSSNSSDCSKEEVIPKQDECIWDNIHEKQCEESCEPGPYMNNPYCE